MQTKLTLAELAGDLIDSLPRASIPDGVLICAPDALTRGIEGR